MSSDMKYSNLWRISALVVSHSCLTPGLAAPVKPETVGTYTVKTGDTFAKIARTKGVGLGELLKVNRIPNPDHILLGQKIVIPGTTVKTGTSAPPTVKPAKPGAVKAITPVRPPAAVPIPEPRSADRADSANTTINLTPPAPQGMYIVASGDTLTRIQRRTGVSLASLLKLNGLTETSTIRPGQSLRLTTTAQTAKTQPAAKPAPSRPLRPEEGVPVIVDNTREPSGGSGKPVADQIASSSTAIAPHKVGTGETFSSIRRLYGVTEAQLAKANPGVNPNRIRIGQTLLVPGQPVRPQPKPVLVRADGRVLAEHPDPLAVATNSNHDDELPAGRTRTGYLVQNGESIQEIARRFHTTEGALRRLNRMGDSDNVYDGRYILVPFSNQAPAPAAQYARRDA